MSLILKQETANSVPTPSAGKGTIFINDSNVLSVKISSGTTSTFPTVVSTNTQVIFNNADSLEGNANFTWNRATSTLSATNVSASGNVTGNYILGNGALLTGVITSVANINSGTSNVTVVSSGGNVTVGVGGTSNVAVFATTGTYVTGIVSASGNVTGSNITTAGLISATANITGGNVLTGGLVSATGTVTGSSLLGSVVSASANVTGGNILTAGVVSAAGAGIFGAGLSVTGNITATGNINYQNVTDLVVGDPLIYIGANNTSDLVDLGIVASANVAGTYQHLGIVRDHATGIWRVFSNVVAEPTTVVDWANSVYAPLAAGAITSNSTISASGNITGGNLIVSGGSGGNLTGGNVISANTFTATANITGGNVLTGGLISATGNITGGNVLGGANVNATTHTGTTVSVSANITGGNILTGGLISATSTITSAANITGGNVLTGGLISATSTITSAANITGGNVLTGGLISATGNITGGNVIVASGSGGNLTGANVISANTFTATANITGGNVLTGGLISATGNITGGNVLGGANVNATTHTGTTVSVSANITGGNILTGGLISATGNITGSYLFGNGSQLTGIAASANAAGSNTYVQFNDGGVFGASANLTFDKATNTLNATTVTANGVQLATTGKAIAMAIVFGF